MILAARALLVDARTWIEGGGLVVERGIVRRVLRSQRAVQRAAGRRLELEELVLTPGLVNAHAHLELGVLRGGISPRRGFVGWIGELLRARASLGAHDLERSVREGAAELLASGTTAVGDIDASGTSTRLARTLGLRVLAYRELLDAWDPARTRGALEPARRATRRAKLVEMGLVGMGLVRAGLSPHAPYTTSRALLAGARGITARRSLALSIHWSETREERAWLETGRGPFARILPAPPRCRGLALLEEAELLGPRTSLVHGNVPHAREPELLARRGVTLVHCPGTHAFFARERFPYSRYRRAGVPLALGTDSLASNSALDLRREMALLRASFPALAPAEVFAMATEGGARALAWAGLGRLGPACAADAVGWELAARGHRAALEELTAASPRPACVLVAGRVRVDARA
jgi:aminodeoxyfutalosine deaminase